jgi:hypothetical protein
MHLRPSPSFAGLLTLLLALALPAGVFAQAAAPATDASTPDGGWPKTINAGTTTFTLYQPQVESFQNDQLTSQIAVAAQDVGAAAQNFGTISVTAQADIDKESGLVTLNNIQITSGKFPGAADNGAAYVTALQAVLGAKSITVAQGRIEASLAIVQASSAAPAQPVQNTPPTIIFSQAPSVLILVDGPPALRDFSGTGYLRVINTRSLIVMNQASGTYYLRLLGGWMQAPALTGPWTFCATPPANLAAVLTAAQNTDGIDLMDPTSESQYTTAQTTVYVSTTPAELLQTQGPPNFTPIPNTSILYAQNTESQFFMYLPTQSYYFLVSGRWFQTTSLQAGPWTFVPYDQLPADFANIPPQHPAGGALASIPSTPSAQQAVISNTIPQTATINRTGPALNVSYDGAPQFQPVDTTTLQYAVNTRTPVIEVAPNSFYAVDNGVWFASPTPAGPWTVAIAVPPVIYSIPVSSPMHYVTYVQVYSYTPTTVVVGYTPGYYGTVVAPANVVVYGTGYVYPVYVNTIWVPPPTTYGSGASFSSGFGTGFVFGFTAGWLIGSWCHPSGCGFGWNSVTINNYNHTSFNHYNSYNHWNNNVVNRNNNNNFNRNNATIAHDNNIDRKNSPAPPRPATPAPRPNAANNVVAGKDGNVYRSTPTGVEQRTGNTWQPAAKTGADPATQKQVQNVQQSRDAGDASARNYGDGTSRTPTGGFTGGGTQRQGFDGGAAARPSGSGGFGGLGDRRNN